jgi:hypothetical protein
VLIVQAADRLPRRDGHEALTELTTIAKAHVAVWFYSDGSQFEYGTFQANVVGFMRAEFGAEFRRSIASKTAEAMRRKAAKGHVCGGSCFGYTNVEREGHVDRIINDAEAAVVRRIFAMAEHEGYSRIAKTLNADGAPCPRPQCGRPPGWGPSTIRDVLHRELYRGEVIWGRTKKRDRSDDINPTSRPPSEWLRTHREDLRLVSDEAWDVAHHRIAQVRVPRAVGGLMVRDVESKYLLASFARCTVCGGSLSVVGRQHGHGQRRWRRLFCGCLGHHKKASCSNGLQLPMERVDAAFLRALASDVLHPRIVTAVIEAVFEQLKPASVDATVASLTQTLRSVEQKITHLTAAVESGAALEPLVAQLRLRQEEREALLAQLASAKALEQIQADRVSIERTVQGYLANWRGLLIADNVADGRRLLREILDGAIQFTPEGKAYRFKARVATGRLLAGLATQGGVSTEGASPAGIDLVCQAVEIDTGSAFHGEMLKAA